MAVEIFKLFGSIFVNNDEANESISATDKKASGVASTLGNGVKTAAKWGAAVLGGATAAATGLTAVATKSTEAADEVDKMSAKIGLSKQGYQEWDYVLGQNGIDISKMQTGMKTLVSNMDSAASGTASAVEMFDKLGLSITDANGNLKGQEEMMNEVLLTLADMPNGTEKARLATELFGKAGTDLMPMLNQGSEGIKDLTERSHELGLIMSDDAVDAGVKLGDTMDDVKQSVSMLGTKLGTSFFPIIQKVCDSLIDYLPQIQAFIEQLAPIFMQFLETVFPVLMDLGETLLPVIMSLLQQLLPVITLLFETLAPIITQILEQLLPPLLQMVEMILPPILNIITALMPLLSTIFELVSPLIAVILQLASTLLDSLLTSLEPVLTNLFAVLNEALQPLIPVITQLAEMIGQTLSPIFEQLGPIIGQILSLLTPIIEIHANLISTLLPALIPLIQFLADIFSNALGKSLDYISNLLGDFMSILGGLLDFISGVFSGDWEKAWYGVVEVFKGIFNLIPTIVEHIINGAISLINNLFEGIDWATEKIGWEIPSIPEVSLPRFRAGIDYVPSDKFPAYLDAGEAVLNAQEAEAYRQAKRSGNTVFGAQQQTTTYNQKFSVNVTVQKIDSNTDIDNLAVLISQKLAEEVKRKEGAYA